MDFINIQLKNRDIVDKAVLKAMEKVRREEFVPSKLIEYAYEDGPLPIGCGQTISQPYIVALMTQCLGLSGKDKVLEIGAGSGYQAAVLAEIVKDVYTIEIVKELAESAKKRLKGLGYKNIIVKYGDGYNGWKQHAPFDGIIMTAASHKIPEPLIDQLREGGRLIAPIGGSFFQELVLLTKEGDHIKTRNITTVRFVPLTGRISGF